MKKSRIASGFACALVASLVLSAAITAFAKEERTKVSKVELNITSRISSGQSTDVRISGKGSFTVDGYEVTNIPDDKWGAYDCPRVEIYLSADEDYYFSSKSSGYFSLKGDADKFVSAELGDEKSTLTLVVDLKPILGKIGNPSDLSWTSNGVATWSKGYKAKEYEVALYRDDNRLRKETTTSTSYDFSSDLQGDYNYYFKVRSSDGHNIYGNWKESEAFTGTPKSSGEEPRTSAGPSGPGAWMNNATGWWYQYPDGSYVSNQWKNIGNVWYYFNGDGYLLTGLQTINGRLYYLQEGDKETGAMRTGWQTVGGKWYFFGEDGAAYVNTNTPDGFYVGADGVWQ